MQIHEKKIFPIYIANFISLQFFWLQQLEQLFWPELIQLILYIVSYNLFCFYPGHNLLFCPIVLLQRRQDMFSMLVPIISVLHLSMALKNIWRNKNDLHNFLKSTIKFAINLISRILIFFLIYTNNCMLT